MWHVPRGDLCTSCLQEGGFEGPENGPKQRRINNRLLSYRPRHRRGNVHNHLIVRWFSVFRNLCRICASVQDCNFFVPLTVHALLNQSSVYRGVYSPGSVKLPAKLESAMFSPFPI